MFFICFFAPTLTPFISFSAHFGAVYAIFKIHSQFPMPVFRDASGHTIEKSILLVSVVTTLKMWNLGILFYAFFQSCVSLGSNRV